MKRRARTLLLALGPLLAACSRTPEAPEGPPQLVLPPDWIQPVLQRRLEEAKAAGLPEVAPEALAPYRQWLDALAAGGRAATAVRNEMEREDARTLTSAFLAVLEDHDSPVSQRRAAQGWLQSRGVPAMLPRLTLRLKYEKDGEAAVLLAVTLLQHGSGAGVDALLAILGPDSGMSDTARAQAAAALRQLPPASGWQPGADFQADWSHALAVRDVWNREHRLASTASDQRSAADDPPPPEILAEIWRMIGRLDSQPLRPVDDGRFVLTRMPCSVLPYLCEAAHDQSRYVREHALETIDWIGYPAGRYARRAQLDLAGFFRTALAEPLTRMQALEALGACGWPENAALATPWLRSPLPEELTAAADALLRCAGPETAAAVSARLAGAASLSDEAHYSLALLQAALGGPSAPPAAARATLAATEKDRRDRWAAARSELTPAPR